MRHLLFPWRNEGTNEICWGNLYFLFFLVIFCHRMGSHLGNFRINNAVISQPKVTGKSWWNHCLVGQTHMSCPEIEYQQQSPENFESPFHFSLCRWSSALIRNKFKGWRVAQLGERNLRQLVICWGFQAWMPLQSWEVLVTFKDQSQYGTEGQLQQLAFV